MSAPAPSSDASSSDSLSACTVMLTSAPGQGVWEENMILGDKPLLWKRARPLPGWKKCSVCKTSKADSDYSGAQLKRQGKRKCADCVLTNRLPNPAAPDAPHVSMLMSCASETDRSPFLPRWKPDSIPAEFTWLAPNAPASHTPPDAETLAARRAIVEPFFASEPFECGSTVLVDCSLPYFTAPNPMSCQRLWVKTCVLTK